MYKDYEDMASAMESFMIPEEGSVANEGALAAILLAPFIIGGVAAAGTLLHESIREAKRKRKLSEVYLHEIINSIADKAKEVEYPEGLLDITNRYIKAYTPLVKQATSIRKRMLEDMIKTKEGEWAQLWSNYKTKYRDTVRKVLSDKNALNEKTAQEVSALDKDNVSNNRDIFQVIRNFYKQVEELSDLEKLEHEAYRKFEEADSSADDQDIVYACIELAYVDVDAPANDETGYDLYYLTKGGLMEPILSVLKVKFK